MDHRFIAQTMCDLTREILWEPRRQWALRRRPDGELILRVGRGKATCVKHRRNGTGPLMLTFGVKMIASKTDPRMLCRWRSGKEILERGYFGGELTLLNVLAHTVVHEFGHVVQVLMGVREPGSSHSPEFYQILDKAHRNGHADRIRDCLHNACLQRGIDLASISYSSDVPSPTTGSGVAMDNLSVGDTVYLREVDFLKYNPLVVTKKNRKTVALRSQTTGHNLKASPNVLYLTA